MSDRDLTAALDHLLLGFLKSTLVHRHAFLPRLKAILDIGRDAAVPASFLEQARDPSRWRSPGWLAVSRAAESGRWSEVSRRCASLPRRGDGGPYSVLLPGLLALHEPARGAGRRSSLEGMLDRYAAPAGLDHLEQAVLADPSWLGRLWSGLAHLRRCDLVRARRDFDALVGSRPDWAWSYILRSELGRVDIEFPAALEDLEKAAVLEPANPWVHAFRSRVRFQMRPSPEALRDMDRAIELDPRSGWLRAWRGDARRKLGDKAGALDDLLAAVRLEPAYDRTYLWLGKVLEDMGRHREALDTLDQGLARCPYFEKALQQRSRVLRRLGRIEDALRDLNAAVRLNHRHDWLGNWTAAPYPLSREQNDSLETLRRFVEGHPRSAWALAWLGEAKAQAQDPDGALRDLDRSLALRPNLAWAHAWRGEALLALDRRPEAEKALNRALRLDPGYGRAYAWRGKLRLLQGCFAPAAADLEKAASDSLVEYSWIYFWKAQAQWDAGRREQAVKSVETAIALEPRREEFQASRRRFEDARFGLGEGGPFESLGHSRMLEDFGARFALPPVIEHESGYFRKLYGAELHAALAAMQPEKDSRAAVFCWRGRLRRLLGDAAGAVADLRRALELDPACAPAHLWLGELSLGEPGSEENLSRALELDPGLSLALLYRGAGRLLRGDARRASEDLERSLALEDSGLGRLLAGLAAERLGSAARALAQYRAAARLEPACSAASLLRARLEKEPAKAALATEQALDAEPTYALITLSWYRGGAWSKHWARLRRFAFEEPERASWYYRQEEIRYSPYHFQEFEDALRLSKAKPGRAWAEALVGRGACRCPPDERRRARGLAALDRAVSRSPRSGWLYAWRALSRIQNGDTKGALADFESSIALQPFYHRAYAWRGALSRKLGRSREALADLDRALAVDELYAFAWHERSLARRARGDWAGAAADLDRAFFLDPRYEWVFAVGREPAAAEQEAAVAELDAALAFEPSSASLRVWRGVCLMRLGRASAAHQDLLRASQLDPRSALAWAWRGRAESERGQFDDAVRSLASALEAEPRLWIAYGWQAEAQSRRGRGAQAFRLLERARRLKPAAAWIYQQRAELALREGKPERALREARRSLRLEGRHAQAHCVLAEARLALGDAAGAERAVERALAISPNLGRAYLVRAQARGHLGRQEALLEDLGTVLRRFPYLLNAEEKSKAEALLAS